MLLLMLLAMLAATDAVKKRPAAAMASEIVGEEAASADVEASGIVPHTGLEPYMGDDDGRLGPTVERTKRLVAQTAALMGMHITPDEVNLQTADFGDYLQSAASSSGHADDAPPHVSQGLVSTVRCTQDLINQTRRYIDQCARLHRAQVRADLEVLRAINERDITLTDVSREIALRYGGILLQPGDEALSDDDDDDTGDGTANLQVHGGDDVSLVQVAKSASRASGSSGGTEEEPNTSGSPPSMMLP